MMPDYAESPEIFKLTVYFTANLHMPELKITALSSSSSQSLPFMHIHVDFKLTKVEGLSDVTFTLY